MKNNKISVLAAILGSVLLISGLVFLKITANPQGIMLTLPYISIGIGCGVFGHGMGSLLSARALKNHPDTAKQMEIEQKDERNLFLGDKAKARAYDMMIYIYGALMLAFALMNIDLIILLLLVGSYIFVISYGIYYRCKLDKEN